MIIALVIIHHLIFIVITITLYFRIGLILLNLLRF